MLRNLLVVCGLAAASAFSAPSLLPRTNVRGLLPRPMHSLSPFRGAVPDTRGAQRGLGRCRQSAGLSKQWHWMDSVARCCSLRAFILFRRCRSEGFRFLVGCRWGSPRQRIPSRTLKCVM